jgi:hypothetical protein
MIRKSSEMLRPRMPLRGCTDMVLSWRSVRLWDEIGMVQSRMGNHWRVADELYIMGLLLTLEDIRFFSLYLFS